MGELMQLAITLYGQEQASKMTSAQLALLQQQLDTVKGVALPNNPSITPDQLGPSAVGGMETDAGMRQKQLDALAEIQQTIDAGGMDTQSKASLEDALSGVNAQQNRARAGVAADLQSRGQLNSGANEVMSLDAAQSGANNARSAGTQAASDAANRRLAAIKDASGMESNLRSSDWSEKLSEAQAKDLRDQYNAAAREKAQYYNAGLPQQAFADAMQKAGATGAPAGNLAAAYAQTGATSAMNAANIGAAAAAAGRGMTSSSGGGGSSSNPNPDVSGGRGGAADLSGGHTDTSDTNDDTWNQWPTS